jgi:hypothetical protein
MKKRTQIEKEIINNLHSVLPDGGCFLYGNESTLHGCGNIPCTC